MDPKTLGSIVFSAITITAFSILVVNLMVNSGLIMRTQVANRGSISTVGVEVNVTSMEWGVLEPGDTRYFPVLLINSGNRPVNLNFTTSDWDPVNASDFIFLGWTYNNEVLEVAEENPVQFILTVDPLIHDIVNFSFNITIFAL